MAKTKTHHDEGIEILEDPEVLASKAQEFFDNKKNRNLVFGVGGAIAILVAAFILYRFYITTQNQQGQEDMIQAVFYFESDSLSNALNGDGNSLGFLDIIDNYSGTDAANLASYYAGSIYLNMGDFKSAIRHLSNFSSSDVLVQAKAYALIGDANMELENYSEAATAYNKAAGYEPNDDYTPIYLQKLAIAHESNGNNKAAAGAYAKIVNDYKKSSLLQEAKKHKARLEGLAAQ